MPSVAVATGAGFPTTEYRSSSMGSPAVSATFPADGDPASSCVGGTTGLRGVVEGDPSLRGKAMEGKAKAMLSPKGVRGVRGGGGGE